MTLKQNGRAEFTVANEASRRIMNGIKAEKTAENTARRKAGLVGWSKLVVKIEQLSSSQLKVTLTFLYQTAL
jgi:hypothetical protein